MKIKHGVVGYLMVSSFALLGVPAAPIPWESAELRTMMVRITAQPILDQIICNVDILTTAAAEFHCPLPAQMAEKAVDSALTECAVKHPELLIKVEESLRKLCAQK